MNIGRGALLSNAHELPWMATLQVATLQVLSEYICVHVRTAYLAESLVAARAGGVGPADVMAHCADEL